MDSKSVQCSRIDDRMIFCGKINTPFGVKLREKWVNTWRLDDNWSLEVYYGPSSIRVGLLVDVFERVYILEYSLPKYKGPLSYYREVLRGLKEINKQLKNHGIVNFEMEIKEYRRLMKNRGYTV